MAYQAKTVAQYTLEGDLIKRFYSAAEAAREVKTNRSFITSCCKGQHRQGKGYIWRYDPDYDIEEFFQDLYSDGRKTMKDHPNYIIFENGGVYSKLSYKYLKPTGHRDGYLRVKLYQGEEKKEKYLQKGESYFEVIYGESVLKV